MYKLAIVISHPIQYHAPLYGYLAKDGRFQLKVFYMSDRGARPFYEELSRTIVRYDNPILEGYEYEFLNSGEPKTWWQKKAEFISLRLSGRLHDFAPQAVYFHGYINPSFWPAILSCRRQGIKVLLRGENEDVLPRPLWRSFIREAFLKILMPNINGYLYIGTRNKEFFIKRNIPESKLFFVPYSVDNNYFKTGCAQAELRELRRKIRNKYALGEDSLLFIYTHKFRPTMRPVDAVRAFCDAIHGADSRAVLIMCGDGELRGEAENWAKAEGQGRVIFAGYLNQTDLREHMLASDIMINPAVEPWGCSVNEGLACGLAIVSSDLVVGWPDMVAPGRNGYVYRCHDLRELSQLIQKLSVLSPDDLAQMKEQSLKLSEKLSFATCANGLAAAMRHFCSP